MRAPFLRERAQTGDMHESGSLERGRVSLETFLAWAEAMHTVCSSRLTPATPAHRAHPERTLPNLTRFPARKPAESLATARGTMSDGFADALAPHTRGASNANVLQRPA